MQVSFFQWIRESVRQSVLLGVADAVESLGAPEQDERYLKQLREAARDGQLPGTTRGKGGSRKRLGRSLKDLDGDAQPSGTRSTQTAKAASAS